MANHSTAPDVKPLSKTWDEAMAGDAASGEFEKSTHYPTLSKPPVQDGSTVPATNQTGLNPPIADDEEEG